MNYLNKIPKRLNASDYRDYLEANADQAAQLSSLIEDFVSYGKTKHRLERLTNKLELTR
jgi:hypothetical protein